MISALKAIFDFLKDIRHYLRFPNAYIAFRGVFQSFEEAMRNTPRNAAQRGSTYNDAKSDELEQLAHAYSKPIKLTDMEYPLFFWLDKITHSATQTRVCDFGGGNGRHYFAYTSHARDVNLEWSVCELAHNVKLGNALAQRLQIPNLRFYEGLDSEPLYQSNVFLSSGAIFYIKDVYESLRRFLSYGGGGG